MDSFSGVARAYYHLDQNPQDFSLAADPPPNAQNAYGGTWTIPAGQEAVHHIHLLAEDVAGNVSSPVDVDVSADAAAPGITINGPGEGACLAPPVSVSFAGADLHLASATATLNGVPYVSGAPITQVGVYTLAVAAADSCGHSAQVSRHFRLKVGPCSGATGNIPDGRLAGTQPMMATRADEAGTSIHVTWDPVNCPSTGYHLLWGYGSSIPDYAPQEPASCDLGLSGAFDWNGVVDPFVDYTGLLWFLVVGDDADATEGGWGYQYVDETYSDRRIGSGSGQCGCTALDAGQCGAMGRDATRSGAAPETTKESSSASGGASTVPINLSVLAGAPIPRLLYYSDDSGKALPAQRWLDEHVGPSTRISSPCEFVSGLRSGLYDVVLTDPSAPGISAAPLHCGIGAGTGLEVSSGEGQRPCGPSCEEVSSELAAFVFQGGGVVFAGGESWNAQCTDTDPFGQGPASQDSRLRTVGVAQEGELRALGAPYGAGAIAFCPWPSSGSENPAVWDLLGAALAYVGPKKGPAPLRGTAVPVTVQIFNSADSQEAVRIRLSLPSGAWIGALDVPSTENPFEWKVSLQAGATKRLRFWLRVPGDGTPLKITVHGEYLGESDWIPLAGRELSVLPAAGTRENELAAALDALIALQQGTLEEREKAAAQRASEALESLQGAAAATREDAECALGQLSTAYIALAPYGGTHEDQCRSHLARLITQWEGVWSEEP